MPIHSIDDIRHELLEDVYAHSDLDALQSNLALPLEEHHPRNAYSIVRDMLLLDGNTRQNFATFCTTWLEPEVRQLMDECIDKNLIDKDQYPQMAKMEGRCVRMLADLWNAPGSAEAVGCSTTGSSEATMLAGLAMKRRWYERRRAAGQPAGRPNLVTGPSQVCWHKLCRYWDIELREIPMEPGRLIMSAEAAVARCDENTIGVMVTLGVTYTCQYEPVMAIAEALDRLEAETGLDIPIHVDAASGGFLAPFVEPELVWDFRLPRVKSINASGHKFGLAPLGVGWIVWREAQDLPEDLVFWVNCLGGDLPTYSFNFSRAGGEIACQYYNFLRLGRGGYQRIHEACYDNARAIAHAIADMGPFALIHDGGHNGLPAVCWTIKPGIDPGFTLYDFADRLRMHGWLVPAYSMPANCTDLVVQRALVRHGISFDVGALLVEDMRAAIAYFARHPVSNPVSECEACCHEHGGRLRLQGLQPLI